MYIRTASAIIKNYCVMCHYYHTSNSRECMGVNGEALQLHGVYKKPYFLLQVTQESVSVLQVSENPYQVRQVTHTASEIAMKSKVRMIKLLSP